MKTKFLQHLILASLALLLCSCKNNPTLLQPQDTIAGLKNHNRPDWIDNEEVYREEGLAFRDETDATASQKASLASIYFEYDGSAISHNQRSKIAEVAEYAKANANAKFLIIGYCDYNGTQEYNLALGDKRAISVQNFLGQLSGNKQNIRTLSRGSLDAKFRGAKEECQPDRRADIILLPPATS